MRLRWLSCSVVTWCPRPHDCTDAGAPCAGDPTYIGPLDDRCDEFYDGRILAAVMVLHPSWISGKRERLRLIPADLDDLQRLSRKVFGKHHEKKVDMFQYDHPKYSRWDGRWEQGAGGGACLCG